MSCERIGTVEPHRRFFAQAPHDGGQDEELLMLTAEGTVVGCRDTDRSLVAAVGLAAAVDLVAAVGRMDCSRLVAAPVRRVRTAAVADLREGHRTGSRRRELLACRRLVEEHGLRTASTVAIGSSGCSLSKSKSGESFESN